MKAQLVLAIGVALVAAASAQQCGRRNSYFRLMNALQSEGSNYIVGGTRAVKNEFPWQISIQVVVGSLWWTSKEHICGGSIINDRWIVTAAHCINPQAPLSSYRIVAGAQLALQPEDTQQERRVARVVLHPEWHDDYVQNDIALIKLAQPLQMSQASVAPVCLPKPTDNFSGQLCTASGWGSEYKKGPTSTILMKVDLPIQNDATCRSRYRFIQGASYDQRMLCAGFTSRSGKGVCQGDSGGPLVCQKNGVYTLAGLTSFGVICGSNNYPAVFTRLSAYRRWIDANID